MKIDSIPSSVPSTLSSQLNSGSFRTPRLGQILLATLSVSVFSLAASPLTHAAKVDGKYEVKSATGSVTFNGDEVDIPKSIVKRIAGVANGDITIQDDTLRLKKKAAIRFAEEIADELDLDIEASVTGPSSVTLEKSGKAYTGQTSRPIVTSFEADAFGVDISGKLKTQVSARVRGKTLTIVVRFGGSGAGSDVSGRVTIVAKR